LENILPNGKCYFIIPAGTKKGKQCAGRCVGEKFFCTAHKYKEIPYMEYRKEQGFI
jgi:hypothetical protein